MATVQIEIGDDGKVGTLPDPVQSFLQTKIDEAYGKGAAKAAADAKTQVESQIAELKKGGLGAAERERLKTLEADLSKSNEELARAKGDAVEAERIRNERHTQQLAERDADVKKAQKEVERRTKRIADMVGKDVKIAALNEGAREESLAELELLLSPRIGLDDGLQAFVRDANDPGKPQLDADGVTPLTIEGLVRQYLAAHPHHKAAPEGRGGGRGGGRSLSGPTGGTAFDREAAAVAQDPSITNVARAFAQVGKR